MTSDTPRTCPVCTGPILRPNKRGIYCTSDCARIAAAAAKRGRRA